MAYDEGLAQRIREQLDGRSGVVEKKMFGGLAFLLRGNMCVGVIGDDLIVRLDPADYDGALGKPGARVFDFTGKPMKNWLVVDGAAIEDDDSLGEWVESGTRFAGSLPAKTSATAAPKPKRAPRPTKPRKPRGRK